MYNQGVVVLFLCTGETGMADLWDDEPVYQGGYLVLQMCPHCDSLGHHPMFDPMSIDHPPGLECIDCGNFIALTQDSDGEESDG